MLCKIQESNFLQKLNIQCLIKSLTFKILAKNSEKFLLVIGVRKCSENFQSHSWIENNNKIIINKLEGMETFKKIYQVK